MRLALQLVCSVTFLLVAFRQVPAGDVLALLFQSRQSAGGALLSPLALGLAAAIAVGLLSALVNTLKWQVLLRAAGVELAWGRVLHHYLVGYFLNTIFTGAGEVKRVIDVGRETGETSAVISTVFVERWTGVMGQLLLSLVALLAACTRFQGLVPVTVLDLAGCLALLLMFAALMAASRTGRGPSEGTAEGHGLRGAWRAALEAFARVRGAPRAMAAAAALSLLVPLLGVLCHACLGFALGAGAGFLWVVPIASVFGQLPVSLNGAGVQEVAYVQLFEATGLSGAQALALSLLAHVVKLSVGGLGGLLSMWVASSREPGGPPAT